MTEEWALPEDLYAAPIVVHEDGAGRMVGTVAWPDKRTCIVSTGAIVSADDLRTIAARFVAIADAIDQPPHDPNAEEWVMVDANGYVRSLRHTKADATEYAENLDRDYPDDAPHRVVHISELPA